MIEALQSESKPDTPFGPHMEVGIVSLLLDFPELYVPTSKFITPSLFSRPEVKLVIAALKQDYDKFGVIPSRALLHDRLAKLLTIDDPYKEILAIVDRPSDPRDAPILRQTLRDWVEHRSYDQLYSDEAIAAHQRGDHEVLRKIIDSATSISMVGQQGFWFFDQIDELFADNAVEHISTGFRTLDLKLNDGGPSPGEVLIYLAPTGVGKTLTIVNSCFAAMRDGHNVLLVTFELSAYKTALRMASLMSNARMRDFCRSNIDKLGEEELRRLRAKQAVVRNAIKTRKGKCGELVIYQLPPDECSVDEIYGIIETNRKAKGWMPKVVALDYLELMQSRHSYNNDKGDYTRQKSVATEMRGLAGNQKVFVYSATQTNRSGIKAGANDAPVHIDLDKAAESFGKAMPVDYVVSLNQTEEEYNHEPDEDGNQRPATIRLWIAKNRNGPKFVSITTNVFYERMRIEEVI